MLNRGKVSIGKEDGPAFSATIFSGRQKNSLHILWWDLLACVIFKRCHIVENSGSRAGIF